MVFGFLRKLFGGGSATDGGERRVAAPQETNVEGFVSYVVQSLVDNPSAVRVRSVDDDRQTTYHIECEKCDIGKVIGKNGKTIAAIRALANGAAGRQGKKVNVEVLD